MALFDMENAVTFRVEDNGLRRSDDRLVFWHEIGGFTTYLDSMGGKDSRQNAFACVVVVAWEPLQSGYKLNADSLAGVNGYILLCWMDRVPLTEQMKNAILLHQRALSMLANLNPESNFVCEQRPDPDGTILTSSNLAFHKAAQDLMFNQRIYYHPQNQNKEARIETLQPAIANGWLAFNAQGLPAEFWTQFRQFPTAEHNDAPDAVQGACRARIHTTARQREYEERRRENRRNIVHI